MTATEVALEDSKPPHVRRTTAWTYLVGHFIGSIAISAGLCVLIWRIVPRSLTGHVSTLGYPIFADFDIKRYYDGFYILIVVFPLLAVLAYHLLGLWSERRKIREVLPLFPITVQHATTSHAEQWGNSYIPWAIVRVAAPATVVAVEVSVTQSPHARLITFLGIATGAIYVVVVFALSAALTALQKRERAESQHRRDLADELSTSMSALNALLGLSVVPLLYGVSRSTAIRVGPALHVVRYPWFPLWLAVVATTALGWWAVKGLRRGPGRSGAFAAENRTLIVVVAAVAVFMFTAEFPGALGRFVGFDDAQYLAAPQLLFGHGLLPWAQMVPFHGLLYDVLGGALGTFVFGNSRWGADAGQSLILIPATWIGFYLLGAYFLRKYRILVVALILAIILGVFGLGTDFRWLFYPYLFIGLCEVLENRSARWSAVFTVAVLIHTIVVPETDLIMAILLLTVVGFELSTHHKGNQLRESFVRSRWCLVTGVVFLLCFSAYLIGTRSLGAFFDYYRAIISVGSGLEGGVPVGRDGVLFSFGGQPSFRYTVELLLPAVLVVLTVWFVASKLRRRSAWTTAQWVMVPAALGVVLYYEEALARLDGGHINEVFLAAVPLIILWIRQGADFIAGSVDTFRRRVPPAARWTPIILPTVLLALLVTVVLCAPISLTNLKSDPSHFNSTAQSPPPAQLARLGYTIPGSVDTTEIEDLRTVLNTYLKPDQPVFDFDNDVGVPYYLLNRVPGTRFDNELDAYSPYAQHLLIADLSKSRPRLVIFTNDTFGLPNVDSDMGQPISDMLHSYDVSQYLLDHYRPLVDVEGQLIMLRDDLFGKVPQLPHLLVKPVTSDLYYATGSCAWGYSPNFLDAPSPHPGPTSRRLAVSKHPFVSFETVSGWAVESATSTPPASVVAVRNGQIVAQTQPALSRPDVVQVLRSPRALTSGFAFSVPAGAGTLGIFAVNANGTASPILGAGISTPVPLPTSITLPGGKTKQVIAGADSGDIDSATTSSARLWTLHVPSGTNVSRFSWMTVNLRGGHGHETFALSNAAGDPTHEITWWALPQSGGRLSVQVGSCLQWHGFGSAGLTLAVSGGGSVNSVVLSN